jgi:hypothetical protein
MGNFIRKHRHEKDLLLRVKRAAQGYLNYFAITDNGERINQFLHELRELLFKWLNRRSQMRSLDEERFGLVLQNIAFPQGNILHPIPKLKTTGVPVRKPYA